MKNVGGMGITPDQLDAFMKMNKLTSAGMPAKGSLPGDEQGQKKGKEQVPDSVESAADDIAVAMNHIRTTRNSIFKSEPETTGNPLADAINRKRGL